MEFIHHRLVKTFRTTIFSYTDRMVTEIFDKDDQKEITVIEHKRTHRAVQENVEKINKPFFPKMTRIADNLFQIVKSFKKLNTIDSPIGR